MDRPRRHTIGVALAGVLIALAAGPPVAQADGPTNPVATSYLAKVTQVPAGLEPKIIDGDLRIWLQVVPSKTVVVLDYRGAPFVRFSRSGVELNHNSPMYYLNQSPAEIPPTSLGPSTAPRWSRVSSGHAYRWDDGRLNSLSKTALAPGTEYAGRWTIPVLVNGRRTAIAGDLLHAENPSIVWFWPILVLLACVLASRRLRRPELDLGVARALSFAALVSIAIAAISLELHGRPTVAVVQFVALGIAIACVAWGLRRVLFAPTGYFYFFVIAFGALGAAGDLVTTLVHGYVLAALPAFVVRAGTVLGLASGGGLLLLLGRLGAQKRARPVPRPARDLVAGPVGDDQVQAPVAPVE
ncbi:MAG: hypothetical protein DLM64_07320 [Solirubrobacterales bacterium]|nr:MAG: hypothetical protein DLM64_07320 [Solirubrobacterales bacterium]